MKSKISKLKEYFNEKSPLDKLRLKSEIENIKTDTLLIRTVSSFVKEVPFLSAVPVDERTEILSFPFSYKNFIFDIRKGA